MHSCSLSYHLLVSSATGPFPTSPSVPPPAAAAARRFLHLSPLPSSPPSLSCALNCPHFQSCSGCAHEFGLSRPSVVDDAEEFFRGFGVSDFTFDSGKLRGWRCRAKLAVCGTSANPRIGLYEEGTHNVVDIPECKAHHPNINAAVELLQKVSVEKWRFKGQCLVNPFSVGQLSNVH